MRTTQIKNPRLLFITSNDRDCHILADRDIERWIYTFEDSNKFSELMEAFNKLQKYKDMLSCKRAYELRPGDTSPLYAGAPTLEECSKYSLEGLPKDIIRNVLLKYFEEWR